MSKLFLAALADFLLCLLAVYVVLVNPPQEAKASDDSQASLIVEISWPAGYEDLDLWVQGPDGVSVGYSNKGGRIFNLLRDDLGTPDTSSNWEISVTRGLPPGEYAVNLHGYRCGLVAVAAKARVTVKPDPTANPIKLWDGEGTVKTGDEITLIRFKLDDRGSLVPGSVHRIPKPLRVP